MQSGTRILLVDDEPLLLSSLRRIVARTRPDAVVVYAATPEAAEWQLQSTTVRLVVTDMRMWSDDRAGMRVIGAARHAGVPVAVLSGADPAFLESLGLEGIAIIHKRTMTTDQVAKLIETVFAA